MILVNGSMGIGTGFSSDIMCYNIIDIINYLKCKLTGDITNISTEFIPYYEGFKGDIIKVNQSKYMFKGKYSQINENTINVIELPIGFWTENFKKLLDKLSSDKDADGKRITPIIKEFLDNSTVDKIDFTITFQSGKLEELKSLMLDNGCNELEKTLKLYTTNTTTNMNLFNHNDRLIKYTNVCDIIDDYYIIRLHYYELRKNKLIQILENELIILRNKSRYISELLDDIIDLRRKTEKQVYDMLYNSDYDLIEESFNYLTGMKMNCVCIEKVESLNNEYLRKEEELNILKNTTIETMWINELNDLEIAYSEYIFHREKSIEENIQLKKSKSNKSSKTSSKPLNSNKSKDLEKLKKESSIKTETSNKKVSNVTMDIIIPLEDISEDEYVGSDVE
jgi:DNA topoisomerase-2